MVEVSGEPVSVSNAEVQVEIARPIAKEQTRHVKMYRDAEIQVDIITESTITVENADMKISYPVQVQERPTVAQVE
jgi:hypothetical protein